MQQGKVSPHLPPIPIPDLLDTAFTMIKNNNYTLQIMNPKPLLPPVTTATQPLTPNKRVMSNEDISKIILVPSATNLVITFFLDQVFTQYKIQF